MVNWCGGGDKVFLITYDLINNATLDDYKRIIEGIKSSYPNAKKLTESCWFISNTSSANAILLALSKFVKNTDRLLVAELKTYPAGKNLLSEVNPFVRQSPKAPPKPLNPFGLK
jgi:cobalamin biosynthesis Co2+ chelatase CbiK